jgi:hypothetical protein
LLRYTVRQLQQGFALQNLYLLLWFVIAFGARRNAQAIRLSARVLGLPPRRTTHARSVSRSRPISAPRPVLPAPALVRSPLHGFPSCCISLR